MMIPLVGRAMQAGADWPHVLEGYHEGGGGPLVQMQAHPRTSPSSCNRLCLQARMAEQPEAVPIYPPAQDDKVYGLGACCHYEETGTVMGAITPRQPWTK